MYDWNLGFRMEKRCSKAQIPGLNIRILATPWLQDLYRNQSKQFDDGGCNIKEWVTQWMCYINQYILFPFFDWGMCKNFPGFLLMDSTHRTWSFHHLVFSSLEGSLHMSICPRMYHICLTGFLAGHSACLDTYLEASIYTYL